MNGTTDQPGAGRYAPSPSGDLHIGNLRTAILAWAFARSEAKRFVLRVEDLDRVAEGAQQRQLRDLASIGIDWDPPVLQQSQREDHHRAAVAELTARGLTYECYCTRREVQAEIAAAGGAPHGAPGAYPGTCRDLTEAQRRERRRHRPPAVRLRTDGSPATIRDRVFGNVTALVDDMVLLRNDGRPAYNLAVVLDDAFQGVDQVVRGDDLLTSAPRQSYLARLLDLPPVDYIHVPLVVNDDGRRLAKRDGAVTLEDLYAAGCSLPEVMGWIGRSLGLGDTVRSVAEVLAGIDRVHLTGGPWVFRPPVHSPGSAGATTAR